MKKHKLILLSTLTLVCALLTYFALIYSNLIYHYFGKLTLFVTLFFPVIAFIAAVISTSEIFKNANIKYIIPVAITLVGCLLAFVLSNEGSLSKIGSDYLKNEAEFNFAAEAVLNEHTESGIFDTDFPKLFSVIPEERVIVEKLDNVHYAIFFIALETSNRYEGYTYIPFGSPIEWLDNGQFSSALDVNANWYYMCLIK